VSDHITGKKKASYTAEFKLKVVLQADKNGKQAAARKFDVDSNSEHTDTYICSV
jgi:transposase-like protein